MYRINEVSDTSSDVPNLPKCPAAIFMLHRTYQVSRTGMKAFTGTGGAGIHVPNIEVSGTGIDEPNLPKCISISVPGTGIDVPKLSKCAVAVIPSVYLGTYRTEHTILITVGIKMICKRKIDYHTHHDIAKKKNNCNTRIVAAPKPRSSESERKMFLPLTDVVNSQKTCHTQDFLAFVPVGIRTTVTVKRVPLCVGSISCRPTPIWGAGPVVAERGFAARLELAALESGPSAPEPGLPAPAVQPSSTDPEAAGDAPLSATPFPGVPLQAMPSVSLVLACQMPSSAMWGVRASCGFL